MQATTRNAEFKQLVAATSAMPFGARLLELAAFAKGAGCKMMFDETGFELRSTSSWNGRLLCKVAK